MTIRVLHMLKTDQHHPPSVLVDATDTVVVVPLAHVATIPLCSVVPTVTSTHGTIDHETHIAARWAHENDLPILGIGGLPTRELDACVSERISASDLRTVLELLSRPAQNAAGDENGEALVAGEHNSTDYVVRLLEHLVALRLPEARKRTERVLDACRWISQHMNLADPDHRALLFAARLRELGKLALPDQILFKTRDRRAPEEQTAYDRYADLGAEALALHPVLRRSARLVECHLENFDGSGPGGLIAHQIPLGARILRVAGALAKTSIGDHTRHSLTQAMRIIEQGSGSFYDPLLLRVVGNLCELQSDAALAANGTRRVRIADLEVGMVLAEDIWNRSGVKIIARGTRLTESMLATMRQFHTDPLMESVEIVC